MAEQLPTLDEVADGFSGAGYTPAQTAGAILKWRDTARGVAESALADSPDTFFALGHNMDTTVGKKIDELRNQAIYGVGVKNFGDDSQKFSDFITAYKKDPQAAAQINPDAASQLGSILESPAFHAPRSSNQFAPLVGATGQELGVFQVQPGAGGKLDVMVNIHPPAPTPGQGTQMLEVATGLDANEITGGGEPMAQGVLKIDPVTDAELADVIQKTKDSYEKNLADSKAGILQKVSEDDPYAAAQAARGSTEKAAEAAARLQELSGPNGRTVLQQERLMKAFKESPLAEKAGQWNILEDAQRAVANLALDVHYAVASTVGTDKYLAETKQAIDALPDVLPGTTRPTQGAELARRGTEFGATLPLLVNPAGVAVLAASTYGGTVKGANDAADAADAQAKLLQTSNPEMSAEFTRMAEGMRRDSKVYSALSAATIATAGKLLPEANTFLGNTARTAAEFGGINAVQGQVLDPLFTGKRGNPLDILEGIVIGGITGAAHAALSGKKAEPQEQPKNAGGAGPAAPPAGELPDYQPNQPPAAPPEDVLVPGTPKAPETPVAAPPPDSATVTPAQVPAEAQPVPAPADSTLPAAKTPAIPLEARTIENPQIRSVVAAKEIAASEGDTAAAQVLQQVETAKRDTLAAEAIAAATETQPVEPNAQANIDANVPRTQANDNAGEVAPALPADQPTAAAPLEPAAVESPAPEQQIISANRGTPAPADKTTISEPRSFRRQSPATAGNFTENPVVGFILSEGGLLSKSQAKARQSTHSEKSAYAVSPELWDGAPSLHSPTHNQIYGGITRPDQMAQTLYDNGLIRDPYVDTMWEAIGSASKTAHEIAAQEHAHNQNLAAEEKAARQEAATTGTPLERKQAKNFREDVLTNDPNKTAVDPTELSIGDTVEVKGEKMKVTATHEDGGVTLEDGKRFGIQKVDGDMLIYGEQIIQQGPPEEPPSGTPPPGAGGSEGKQPFNPSNDVRLTLADEDARRIAEGKDPLHRVSQGTEEDWNRLGQRDYLQGKAPALVADLIERPRPRSPVEDATLKNYAGGLDQKIKDSSVIMSDPDATETQKTEAARDHQFNSEQRERVALAANLASSAWGAAGRGLQVALKRADIPPLPQIIADRMTMKGKAEGKPFADLTPEERQQIEERYAAVIAKEAALKAHEEQGAKNAETEANTKLLEETRAELEKTKAELAAALNAPPKGAPRPTFTKRVVDAISVKADAARERLKARGMQFNTSLAAIDPTLLADYATIMAEYIAKGVDASAEMIRTFGKSIAGGLKEIEAAAREILANEIKLKTPEDLKAKLRADQEADPERMVGQHFVRELAKAHIREALESGTQLTRKELNERVLKDVHEFAPEMTMQEVRDLRTGYGKQTLPSDNPVDVRLRELNRIDQLFSSLERAEKGLPGLKSGPQRDKATAEIRDMQKQLNDAMARNGIETRSPESQLAGRREGIKTRLTNEIEDLQRQIDGLTKARPPAAPFEYDKELEDLATHRDNLKKIVDAMPENAAASEKAKDDAAVKAAQDAEKEWNRRANEIDFGKQKLPPGERSARVNEARAKAEEARKRYLDLKKSEKVNEPAAYFNEIASKVTEAEKRIKEIEGKLNRGDTTVDQPETQPTHPLLEEKRARVTELNKELAKLRVEAERPEREAQRAQDALDDAEARVIQLEEKLRYGDLSKNPVRHATVSAELNAAREQIKGLNKALEKARSDADKPRRDSEKAARELEDAKKSVAAVERKLATGDLSIRPVTPRTVPADLAAERLKLKDLNKQLAQARRVMPLPDVKARDQFKARVKKQIADLRMRRVSGNFDRAGRSPAQIRHDAESERLAFELQKEKDAFTEDQLHAKLAARGPVQKIFAGVGEVTNTARAMMTSFDASAVLRQGGFIALGNPMRALKAFPEMFRALSKQGAFRAQQALENRPNYRNGEYDRAKLFLAKEGTSLAKMEEAYMSRWAQKVPGVGASERIYKAFLNRLRADTFDAMTETLARGGNATKEESRAIANYINVATGRGGTAGLDKAAVVLNHLFFSPRYLVSRFQLLAGQPFYGGSARTRKLIAQEYGKYLIGASVVYGLSALAGGDADFSDPTNSEWGKIKFGNTRLDPLGGLIQATVFLSREGEALSRFASGDTSKPPKYDTGGDVLGRFLRSKLSPQLGAAVDAVSGKNIVGEQVTPGSLAARSLVPLSFNDIYETMINQDVPTGAALSILAIFGMGLQNYQAKH